MKIFQGCLGGDLRFNILETVRDQLKAHGLDNIKQDIIYKNINGKMIKVKIINHKSRVNGEGDMVDRIKVFYNIIDEVNE